MFSSEDLLIPLLVSSLVRGLSKSVLFCSQIFGDFPKIGLLLISDLTPRGQKALFAWFEFIERGFMFCVCSAVGGGMFRMNQLRPVGQQCSSDLLCP